MAESLSATFFAFRRRERAGVLTAASLAFIVAGLALVAAFVAIFWGALSGVAAWYFQLLGAAMSQDVGAIDQLQFPMGFFALLPGLLVWLFLFYVLYAAYEAACLRWMVRGESGGLFGLTLGADTWRVYLGYWVWFGLYLAGSTALSIVMIAVTSVLALGSAGSGADPTAMGLSMGGAIVLLYVLYYAAMIFFAVRFAPAAATSIARRRFAFFDAWTVTKGRFWELLGAFFVLWLLYCVFAIVLGVIGFAVVLGSAAPHFIEAFSNLDAVDGVQQIFQAYVGAFSKPSTWIAIGIWQVVAWVGGLLLYVAMFGVNARAALAALDEGKIIKPTEEA